MINKNLHFSSGAYGWRSWFWWLSSWENHTQLFPRHAGDSGDDFSFIPQRNNHDDDVEKLPVEGDPGVTGNKRRLKIRIIWTGSLAVLQSSL